jgi:hypothetical protein
VLVLRAQAHHFVDEQDTIEMVDLVLQNSRSEASCGNANARTVERLGDAAHLSCGRHQRNAQ